MIGRLSGKLAGKQPPQVLVDVGGVAYELDVPMSTFYNLPATGEAVSLYTHLVVREDAHTLYGFATLEERTAFRQLIRISGVGARTALAVLSGLSVADLAHAVALQVKQSVVGNGHAAKDQVSHMVRRLLALPGSPAADAADALACAICHAHGRMLGALDTRSLRMKKGRLV